MALMSDGDVVQGLGKLDAVRTLLCFVPVAGGKLSFVLIRGDKDKVQCG